MKKIFFGLIATVVLTNLTFAQTSTSAWSNMIGNFKNSVNSILAKECPKDMELNAYKISLLNGKNKLSEDAQNEITSYMQPLKAYGLEVAKKHGIEAASDSDLIFYSGLSPDLTISNGMLFETQLLTRNLIAHCALVALGVDALYSLAFSGATSWSIGALTTAFTGVAKRFLGPIGVAIAVVSFTLCLADAN